jgi:hypothetical protein
LGGGGGNFPVYVLNLLKIFIGEYKNNHSTKYGDKTCSGLHLYKKN